MVAPMVEARTVWVKREVAATAEGAPVAAVMELEREPSSPLALIRSSLQRPMLKRGNLLVSCEQRMRYPHLLPRQPQLWKQ